MKQTGKVIETRGEIAIVRFCRSDACGHCNACFAIGSREADIEIENVLGAAAGDTVVIELHGGSVLRASLLMYGIPIVALICGVVLGSIWGDLYAALGGVLFAAGTFFIFRGLEPRLSRMGTFKPRMTELVQGGEKQVQ
ncbi:MAG: SoxR reducing system RseC family protein [Clostridia bacterium]